VLQDFGQRVEMPLHVSDPDRNLVALYYKLGDSTEWSAVPLMETPNLWASSMFTGLVHKGNQSLHIITFDCQDESDPITLNDVVQVPAARGRIHSCSSTAGCACGTAAFSGE
jgi:hypothetical protein